MWLLYSVYQGSPAPGPQTGSGEASSIFTGAPHPSHYHLSSASCQIVAALDSHRSRNPTGDHSCQGSGLPAPYENLMPDDLSWSWGSDASAGEWLQIQIIISTVNVMCLNHPETISHLAHLPVCGEIIFSESSPWRQKGWGPLLSLLALLVKSHFHISEIRLCLMIDVHFYCSACFSPQKLLLNWWNILPINSV